jgi:hypothetical protein
MRQRARVVIAPILVLPLVALGALLAPALVASQAKSTEFTVLNMWFAGERGAISCPGGGDPSPSLMPPWCEPGSRTHVRDRALVGKVTESTDPRIAGAVFTRINLNLDSSTFSGEAWGTYVIEVPERGRWEGIWQGKVHRIDYWTYELVLHGSGEFEGMQIKADGVWPAEDGMGERLTGRILETPRK